MKIDGLPVVDAKKKVSIFISAADIKRGAKKNSNTCAAAQACLRQLKCTEARVYLSRVVIRTGNKWTRYKTPSSLRGEIVSFDRGGVFQSGEYLLNPPPPSEQLGAYADKEETRASRKVKKKRAKQHVLKGVRASAPKGRAVA